MSTYMAGVMKRKWNVSHVIHCSYMHTNNTPIHANNMCTHKYTCICIYTYLTGIIEVYK